MVSPSPAPFPPALVALFGNPDLKSEELLAYELGYRIELTKRCSFDVAGFYNDYGRLILGVPGTPQLETTPPPPHVLVPATNENDGRVHTYGVELSGHWDVTRYWHLTASWTWFEAQARMGSPVWNASPEQQFQVRSGFNLPYNFEWNTAVYYVGEIQAPYVNGNGAISIPAYVRLDLGLTWHPTKSLELG